MQLISTYRMSSSLSAEVRITVKLKRGLNSKSIGLFKVTAITLDWIGVDSILLDPAVLKIFYFKHDVGASIFLIFIGNPEVLI